MAIRIRRVDSKYIAEVTPPHGGGSRWASPGPMSADDVIAKLRSLGCHQTDIADAFDEADPGWDMRSDDG